MFLESLQPKIKSFFHGISSGFLLFAFLTAHNISHISNENLLLDKACRLSANLSKTSCDAMVLRNRSAYPEEEELEVQKIVSEVQIYITFLNGLLPIICIALLGSWSDEKEKRKPLIIVPTLGHILTQVGLLVCYWFPGVPIEYVGFSQAVPFSLLGGEYCCLIGIYTYMAVNTDVSSRSEGVARIIAFNILAVIVGRPAGGILFKAVGYVGVYSISIVMFLMGIFYTLWVLPAESEKKSEEKVSPFKYLSQGFSVIFKMDSEKRKKIIAVILAGTLSNTSAEGESSIIYIYTRRKFNWDEIDYSMYITTLYSVQLVGTFIAIYLLMKTLKCGDITLGLIGIASGVQYALISSFAETGLAFYIGTLVSLFLGNTILSLRAMILKISDSQELGRLNSLFGIFNSATPLLGGPIYNFVYKNTLEKFPSAYYLLSTTFQVSILSLFVWMFFLNRKQS